MMLGHEAVGEVVEVGSMVEDFKVGDQVIIPAITPDWSSVAAQETYAMHSGVPLGGWEFSNIKDGVFAELIHVNDADGNLAHLPEGISPEVGAMLSDMVTTGLHGAELASIEPGDVVAVIGIGPVGLMSVASASVLGAGRLFAVGSRPKCIEVAQEYGATDIINYREGGIVEQIMEATKGQGVNRVIVAGGDLDTFQQAFDILKAGGRVANVNYLLEEGAEPGELSPDALGSYYVDYYLAEVMNGGISQFMFNCSGDHQVLDHITHALPLLGATRHAELFSEVRARWEAKDAEEQRAFLDGGLFESADLFEELSDRFSEVNRSEDLIELNSAFIRNHPNVEVIRLKHLEAHLAGIIRTIPDLAARLAERERFAEENKPRYARIIDVICEEQGVELARITAGDPGFIHEGEERVAWHFLTDQGHCSMVDLGERAVVFDDDGKEVAVVDISRDPVG